MAPSSHHLFGLLLWKNWKLQLRKKLVTVVEILLPTFFFVILILLRTLVVTTTYDDPFTFRAQSIRCIPFDTLNTMNTTNPIIVGYTPKNAHTTQIMESVKDLGCGIKINVEGFSSEGSMVDTLIYSALGADNTKTYFGGVAFEGDEIKKGNLSKDVHYTIRLSYTPREEKQNSFIVIGEWYTERVFPVFLIPGPRNGKNPTGADPNYYSEGFLALQHAIDRGIIQEQLDMAATNSSVLENTEVLSQVFPYPPYLSNIFLVVLETQVPFLFMLSFIFIALNIPREVVTEKELKLKEAMKMMGMNNWLHWLAWFTKYAMFMAVATGIVTFLVCPPFEMPENARIFSHTDSSLVFVFLFLYAITTICFCFMVSVFFEKANAAAAAGGILFFVTYIPYFFIEPSYDRLSSGEKYAASILHNDAMALGSYIIAQFEAAGGGATWSNFAQPVNVDDNFSLAEAMLMLIVDAVFYMIVMWYVEAVFPGSFGVPMKWYFPFLPSYWCGTKQNLNSEDAETSHSTSPKSDMFEADPLDVLARVQIRGLTKVFNKGKKMQKVAVNDITLNMFDGQITALLGHNGAGKTTTMFMLTGFLPPTGGDAVVNGYSIREDITNVRANLGLCPQHNILFNNLTVEEHLWFFGKLKGCTVATINSEIDYFLKRMDLEPKRHSFASTLSGGQKRKLSVIIALIGGSKVVILDEPTSGMDPSARQFMWDVLQEQRAGRTMILSTHFMDEADHLGDRIAIMAEGSLQCAGTPMFLKNKYGAGYHMVMVKDDRCNVRTITDLVQQYVPNSRLESSVAAEISYILPHEGVSHFEALFLELETRKEELGILSYGASVTTMEEVFIRVGEKAEHGDNKSMNEQMKEHINEAFEGGENVPLLPRSTPSTRSSRAKIDGASLWFIQLYAMLIKRIIYTRRNLTLTLSQIILPLFFTITTIVVMKTLPQAGVLPSIDLTMDQFGDSPTTFYGYNSSSPGEGFLKDVVDNYTPLFASSHVSRKENVTSAIIDIGKESVASYSFKHVVAADFLEKDAVVNVHAMFNAAPYHSAGVTVSLADNAILRTALNSGGGGEKEYSITTSNYPLPQSVQKQAVAAATTFNQKGFSFSSNTMFGMSFLASSFVVFLIQERSSKVKHSQYVSGVGPSNFWLATFLWDMVNYLVPCCLIIVSYAIFDEKNMYEDSQWALLLILFIFYGLALLPNVYLLQFLFTGPATGYVIVTFYNIFTGIAPVLIVSILDVVNEGTLADVLTWVFIVILPNFNMGQGIVSLYNNYDYVILCTKTIPEEIYKSEGVKLTIDEICEKLKHPPLNGTTIPCCKDNCGTSCLDWTQDNFSWDSPGLGRPLLFLSVQCLLFWLIIFVIESESLRRVFYFLRPKKVIRAADDDQTAVIEDSDVKMENEKAHMANPDHQPVIIKGLSKNFGTNKAVDKLSLVIPEGECFGLLGVNGAGKTTTFRMLTGDEILSGGDAYLNGNSVRERIKEVQKGVGYCPQFDALIDQMTGEETLYMYARLRGIPSLEIPRVVNDLLNTLLLKAHAKKLTKEYSGGNKRKLSTAISLIGDAPVIFLDEPTTGMDPVAKRMLWDTLTHVRKSGKTLVLTSHSMEECEALCTRMAIMVNGRFRCLGSTQHLKTKFGRGYSLHAKVGYPRPAATSLVTRRSISNDNDSGNSSEGSSSASLNPDLTGLREFIETTFPGSILKDFHQNLVQYSVPSEGLSWSKIFGIMERSRERFNIEDYSVSQTTLEQVFIGFARSQDEPNEKSSGLFSRLRSSCICCVPEYTLLD